MSTSTPTALQRMRLALEQAQQALEQARAALVVLELQTAPAPALASTYSEAAVPPGLGYTSSALTEDTPLSAVMSYLNFLQETEGLSNEAHAQVSKAVMDYLTFLQDEEDHVPAGQGQQASRLTSAHLLSLISDLLEYAKILQGAQNTEPVDMDLHWAVTQIHELLHARAVDKDLDYDLIFAEDLPVAARLDLASLTRVLVEVLGNAIKFTAHGRVLTQVSVLPPAVGADHEAVLCIAVSDSGSGVALQDAQRIFEPFVQLDPGRAVGHDADGHGHGLGLAMARSLARAHGGDLLLRASSAGGSTFEIQWPVQAVQAAPMLSQAMAKDQMLDASGLDAVDPPLSAASAPEGVRPSSVGDELADLCPRVLVVDDHQLNRMVAMATFKRAFPNAVLDEAKNGTEALEKLGQQLYDLVLMDLVMPDYMGTEVVRRVRAMPPPLCDVLVIAGTANVGEEAIAECAKVGISHVMAKPLNVKFLVKTVRDLLQQ